MISPLILAPVLGTPRRRYLWAAGPPGEFCHIFASGALAAVAAEAEAGAQARAHERTGGHAGTRLQPGQAVDEQGTVVGDGLAS